MAPLQPHVRQGLFVGRVMRDPNPQIKQCILQEIRELAKQPDAPILAQLSFIYQLGLHDEVFDLVRARSFAEVHDSTGATPSGWTDPGVIYSMFRDVRFVGLCMKLGLCDYWVKTDRWPDCAGLVAYDFKAECRRLVGGTAGP